METVSKWEKSNNRINLESSHVWNGLVQERNERHRKDPYLETNKNDIFPLCIFDPVSPESRWIEQVN